MNTYGIGFSVIKTISKHFSSSGGYDFSIIDRGSNSYNRHILKAQVNGTFFNSAFWYRENNPIIDPSCPI